MQTMKLSCAHINYKYDWVWYRPSALYIRVLIPHYTIIVHIIMVTSDRKLAPCDNATMHACMAWATEFSLHSAVLHIHVYAIDGGIGGTAVWDFFWGGGALNPWRGSSIFLWKLRDRDQGGHISDCIQGQCLWTILYHLFGRSIRHFS